MIKDANIVVRLTFGDDYNHSLSFHNYLSRFINTCYIKNKSCGLAYL